MFWMWIMHEPKMQSIGTCHLAARLDLSAVLALRLGR